MLEHYPLRHVDKTRVETITSLNPGSDYVQVAGKLLSLQLAGEGRAKRLVAHLQDATGVLELVWFQGITWVDKYLKVGDTYLVYGKPGFFMSKPQMSHPEIEKFNTKEAAAKSYLEPVYPSTEKLKAKGLHGRAIAKFTQELFKRITEKELPEILPENILQQYRLMNRYEAYKQIHFPASVTQYQQALRRLKFEELFLSQLKIQQARINRIRLSRGQVFSKLGNLFNDFYAHHLPFSLTGAQKRVLKEIRKDTASGHQMNRLLQGDVGSGKTMVALLSMLMAADNGFQSVLMAPTEILARQHFNTISDLLKQLPVTVKLLTGSTVAKERKQILSGCADGSVHILIGTHAVIEDKVQFQSLGFSVVDEQHKFGVAQRASLWKKSTIPPHTLVMTATPIPRTMAMTIYGDLDYSVIDELPPGRKPVKTLHRNESQRMQVMEFIREQIKLGRQAYVIYPLIEESSALDYENLMKGFEEVKAFFPPPEYYISMVHGKQNAELKETNMQRFVSGDTQILVGTTVIEVGVNVPNASVMVIESAEKFGLSQLHQLRGRVGRGADQSFCILLTGNKCTSVAKQRLKIMVDTNDGFVIAEKDLEIRGPGEMEGTRQSGVLLFKLANLVEDKIMLEAAKNVVAHLFATDPVLEKEEHQALKKHQDAQKTKIRWGKIA